MEDNAHVSEMVILPQVAAAAPVRTRGILPAGLNVAAWLLLAPSLLFLAAFTYWPIGTSMMRALTEQQFGQQPRWGLGNFARLFADEPFQHAAINSTLYAVFTIAPSLALALGFALALRESGRLVGVLRTGLVLPMLIPLVAAAALFTFILLPGGGLLDWYLAKLGAGTHNWLGNPDTALGAIIGITIWKNTGYYMLFFLAGLAGIPLEYSEAAKIDGAGALRRFWHITLPLLGPTLAFVLVIAALNALTQIDHVVVMTKGGPTDATNMLLYYIYQQAEQNYDAGLAAAATVVSVCVLLAMAAVALKRLEAGIHYES